MHGCWRAKMYVLTILQKVCNQSGHSFDVLLKHVSRMKLILILFGTGNIQRRSSHIYGFIKEIILVLVWRFLFHLGSIQLCIISCVCQTICGAIHLARPSVCLPWMTKPLAMDSMCRLSHQNPFIPDMPLGTIDLNCCILLSVAFTLAGSHSVSDVRTIQVEHPDVTLTGWFTEAYTFLFCKIDLQERESYWDDLIKNIFNTDLRLDAHEPVSFNLCYILSQVLVTLTSSHDYRVQRKLELVQSFCCKVAWSCHNFYNGRLCWGDDCKEVLKVWQMLVVWAFGPYVCLFFSFKFSLIIITTVFCYLIQDNVSMLK